LWNVGSIGDGLSRGYTRTPGFFCEHRRRLKRIAITASERTAGAVANQVANTRLRAIEVERRMREADELEGVLEEAERRTYVSGR
jgi:hypothetical protein